jgi:hypothetical protein
VQLSLAYPRFGRSQFLRSSNSEPSLCMSARLLASKNQISVG